MSERANDVLATLQSADPAFYSYEQNERTMRAFMAAGATQTVIVTGGFRLVVTHLDDVLVSITPKARTAGRGEIVIWSGAPSADRNMPIMGRAYFVDWYGTNRLVQALTIAALAWDTAGGEVDKLYKAIGARGCCAMCGTPLSDPLSIDRGIGPECIKRVHGRTVIQKLQARNLAAV